MHKYRLLTVALIAALAVVGCKKKDEAAVATPDATPAPTAMPNAMPTDPAIAMPMPDPSMASTFVVRTIDLGSAIGADNRVTTPATTFRPSDTIYAAVASDGSAASVNVGAKWSFEDGQMVNEASQAIAPTGPAVTTFNISKPDGFPVGRYKVEVMVDGQPAGMSEFEVR
ncbi:MAG: hypothetical protein ABIP49_02255 [Lysobacterales bacterium]